MTQKELQEYRELCKEIDRLDLDRQQWESIAQRVTSGYSLTPGRGMGGSFSHAAEKVIALKEKIEEKIVLLVERREPIVKAIEMLEQESYRELLTLRYLLGWTWERIAEQMHYSYRHVTRLHGCALKAMQGKTYDMS